MPRNTRTKTALLLALVLLFGCFSPVNAENGSSAPSWEALPAGTSAEAEPQEAASDGTAAGGPPEGFSYPMGYLDSGKRVPALSDDWLSPVLLADIPEAFDLRSVDGVNYMTAVRDQNPYGTCWAHAVVASAESNLLMDGRSGYENLSEMQLINYTYNRNAEVAAEGGTPGDIATHSATVSSDNIMQSGGNSENAITALSSWLGLIQETELPYPDSDNADDPSENVLQIINGTLDNSYARSKNVVQLDYAYAVNMKSDPMAVKNLLMTEGAAATSYYFASAYGSSSIYGAGNGPSYYYNAGTTTNHAVTLCGWDDTYPASSFGGSAGAVPTADGAWLCKNNWGTWYGDGGYFWVSYEDTSMNTAYFIGVIPAREDYTYLYQHDGGFHSASFNYGQNVIYGANVFTASRDELLKAVRVDIDNTGATVTVDIYTGPDLTGDPTSGTSRGTTTAECPYMGTYTIPLDAPVSLTKGDVFSVVVTVSVPSGSEAALTFDYPLSYNNGSRTSSPTISAGQSFISYDGTSWTDMAEEYNNLRIKALTDTGAGLAGDVNLDDKVGITDAVLVARYVVNAQELGKAERTAADANSDGRVDLLDVLQICKIIAGTAAQ